MKEIIKKVCYEVHGNALWDIWNLQTRYGYRLFWIKYKKGEEHSKLTSCVCYFLKTPFGKK